MDTAIVIGGGAAGLMACGVLAKRHEKVVLIEHNSLLAKKVRITGKGRCNITNDAEIGEFFAHIPTNPKFLYSALYSFTNEDTKRFFEDMGVPLKVERGGRVFPVSDNANDAADALIRWALQNNVRCIKASAEQLLIKDGRICGVKAADGRKIEGDAVVLATGGMSYPLTGSDGSGYRLAKGVGHTVTTLKPSLIPIETEEKWPRELAGLSLRNIVLKVYGKKKVYEEMGEMLFTHFGVSGPVILSASSHMRKIDKEGYRLEIDLKPALSEERLDRRILRDFEKYVNKQLKNALDDLLPKALVPVVISIARISREKAVNSITKEERRRLVTVLKALPLTVKGFRPIKEAIITSGGVSVKEIDPSTMESKIIKGLYFAGEIIDVDAYTGGYNLQIAFSTGHLAGENA